MNCPPAPCVPCSPCPLLSLITQGVGDLELSLGVSSYEPSPFVDPVALQKDDEYEDEIDVAYSGGPGPPPCTLSFVWSNPPVVSGNTATGVINGINYTYVSSEPVVLSPYVQGHAEFPSSFGVPNIPYAAIENTQATTNVLTFATPLLNPVLVFASIGFDVGFVSVNFSGPVDILFSKNVVQNTPTTITGNEGFVILQFTGIFSEVSFDYTTAEYRADFVFGSSFCI